MSARSSYPTGEFIIVVRDKDTGAVKRVQRENNIVTSPGVNQFMSGAPIWYNSGGDQSRHIMLSNRRVSADIFNKTTTRNNYVFGVSSPSGNHVRVIEKTISTPPYVELLNRFDPGASVRTINSIYVCNTLSSAAFGNVAAYVSLGTPCIQQTTEVLDVYYRYQIVNETDPNSLPMPLEADICAAGTAAGDGHVTVANGYFPSIYDDAQRDAAPTNALCYWNPNIPEASQFNYYSFGTTQLSQLTTSSSANYLRWGMRYTTASPTISHNQGEIIGSILHGKTEAGYLMYPGVEKGFSVVQPIHNHNKDTVGPFLDVGFLASGTGSIFIDSTDWANADYPEFYRFDIAQSGDVGTSYYALSKRCVTGFNGNTYVSSGSGAGGQAGVGMPTICYGMSGSTPRSTQTRTHHPLQISSVSTVRQPVNANIEKYDDYTVMSWDSTGVTLNDLKYQKFYDLDATSSPALNVTAVKQCAVDDSGNIWVACADTGLYKITDPKGSPTVTNYTTFNALVTSNAYAVDVGNSNNVFAVVNGAIVRTSTSGASWTNYDTLSTPDFTYTGISDSNWSNVRFIRLQKDSPDFRMGIVRTTGANDWEFVWWSLSVPAKQGPSGYNSSSWDSAYPLDLWINRTSYFRCSRTGGMWLFTNPTANNNLAAALLYFNSGVYNPATFGGNSFSFVYGHAPVFHYDYYGNAYFTQSNAGGFPRSGQLSGARFTSYGGFTSPGTYSEGKYGPNYINAPISCELGKGLQLVVFSAGQSTQRYSLAQVNPMNSASYPGTAGIQDLSLTSDTPSFGVGQYPFNGRYTPREEFVWEHYGWNGAAWVKDYYVDAPDSSAGSYDAPRHNFNPESWIFTGRSSIDVTQVGTATNFTNQLTFACQVTPVNKTTPGQFSLDQVLFSSYDKGRVFPIVGVTTGLNGEWIIKGNWTSLFTISTKFAVEKNSHAGSNTVWEVSSSSYNGGTDETTIVVNGTINGSADFDGFITTSYIALYLRNHAGNIGIYESGSFTSFGAFPGTINGTNTFNIVLTVDGDDVHCYVNGSQVGTGITLSAPLRWDNTSGQNQIWLGGLGPNSGGYGWEWAEEFYKGEMLNAIFWQGVWNSTNISDHNSTPLAAPSTFGSGAPAGTERGRYQLNESLLGLETKATHSTSEDLINGLKNRFANGVGSPAFYADPDYFTTGLTDHYTFGVVDGMLKDNAISYTYTTRSFVLPVEHEFGTFTPATVPAASSVVTEPIYWRYNGETTTLSLMDPSNTNCEGNYHGYQAATGDFVMSWQMEDWITEPAADGAGEGRSQGMSSQSGVSPLPAETYALRFKGDGNVDAVYSGGVVSSNVTTWAYGDTWTMQRSGVTFSATKNAAPFYTWATTSGATHWPRSVRIGSSGQFAAYNCQLTYDLPARTVRIGDGISTGAFSNRFLCVDTWQPNEVMDISFDQWSVVSITPSTKLIKISGNHAAALSGGQKLRLFGNTETNANKRYTVASAVDNGPDTDITVNEIIPGTADNTGTVWKLATIHAPGVTTGAYTDDQTTLPLPGSYEVTVVDRAGHILCNSAQDGATLYGAVTLVYKKPA